jgi:hypothetical protein
LSFALDVQHAAGDAVIGDRFLDGRVDLAKLRGVKGLARLEGGAGGEEEKDLECGGNAAAPGASRRSLDRGRRLTPPP